MCNKRGEKRQENENTDTGWNSGEISDTLQEMFVHNLARKLGKIMLKQPRCINISPRNVKIGVKYLFVINWVL